MINKDTNKTHIDNKLMTIGLSIPDNLLFKFDEIINERGYSSRSEGIRDSIRNYINYYDWTKNIKGQRIATITLVYDLHKRGLIININEILSEYFKIIISSMCINLDKNNYMEVIVLKGDGVTIKKLSEQLLSQNGVYFSKLTTIIPIDE